MCGVQRLLKAADTAALMPRGSMPELKTVNTWQLITGTSHLCLNRWVIKLTIKLQVCAWGWNCPNVFPTTSFLPLCPCSEAGTLKTNTFLNMPFLFFIKCMYNNARQVCYNQSIHTMPSTERKHIFVYLEGNNSGRNFSDAFRKRGTGSSCAHRPRRCLRYFSIW